MRAGRTRNPFRPYFFVRILQPSAPAYNGTERNVIALARVRQPYGKVEKRYFKWIYLFLLPSVIVFIMFYVKPIWTMVWTSFTKWDGFNDPSFIGMKN